MKKSSKKFICFLAIIVTLIFFTLNFKENECILKKDLVVIEEDNVALVKYGPRHDEKEQQFHGQRKLIIMTYMRSGSTLMGDLFQQSRDVFYFYEPLWNTERMLLNLTDTKYLKFLNGTVLNFSYDEEFVNNRKLQILESVLNCNLMDLDIGTVTQYHMYNSLSTRILHTGCARNVSDLDKLSQCVEAVQNVCKKSKVIVIKVIRSSMADMFYLMLDDSNLKILHLIRDPRGTLMSQFYVREFKWSNVSDVAQHHCGQILLDLKLSKLTAVKFPGRIHTIRYEDLVENPVVTAQQLYSLVHLNMTTEIQSYIWNITYAGNPDSCNICTVRKNATETAYAWRKNLSFENILSIQFYCQRTMHILGYRLFTNEGEKTNLSIQSKY